MIILPVTTPGFDSAENIYTCFHAFFFSLKRQGFLCENFTLSPWREARSRATPARVKTWLTFCCCVFCFGLFSFFKFGFILWNFPPLLANCVGFLGRTTVHLTQFGNRCVFCFAMSFSPHYCKYSPNLMSCTLCLVIMKWNFHPCINSDIELTKKNTQKYNQDNKKNCKTGKIQMSEDRYQYRRPEGPIIHADKKGRVGVVSCCR